VDPGEERARVPEGGTAGYQYFLELSSHSKSEGYMAILQPFYEAVAANARRNRPGLTRGQIQPVLQALAQATGVAEPRILRYLRLSEKIQLHCMRAHHLYRLRD
jgi:hypothetical protein